MERVDEIGFGGYVLHQDPEGFCYGIDAVLLAHYAYLHGEPALTIADFGTGNGIVPIIMCHKIDNIKVTGFEIQKSGADLASKNAKVNGLSERIKVVNDDILNIGSEYEGAFDMVVCNPPYVKKNSGIKNTNPKITTARHETTAGLIDFIRVGSKCLKQYGKMLFVHRPTRLPDLIESADKCGFGIDDVTMVHPFKNKNANIMLCSLVKGRKCDLKVSPPIIVRNDNGEYTDDIKKIYEIM